MSIFDIIMTYKNKENKGFKMLKFVRVTHSLPYKEYAIFLDVGDNEFVCVHTTETCEGMFDQMTWIPSSIYTLKASEYVTEDNYKIEDVYMMDIKLLSFIVRKITQIQELKDCIGRTAQLVSKV